MALAVFSFQFSFDFKLHMHAQKFLLRYPVRCASPSSGLEYLFDRLQL